MQIAEANAKAVRKVLYQHCEAQSIDKRLPFWCIAKDSHMASVCFTSVKVSSLFMWTFTVQSSQLWHSSEFTKVNSQWRGERRVCDFPLRSQICTQLKTFEITGAFYFCLYICAWLVCHWMLHVFHNGVKYHFSEFNFKATLKAKQNSIPIIPWIFTSC